MRLSITEEKEKGEQERANIIQASQSIQSIEKELVAQVSRLEEEVNNLKEQKEEIQDQRHLESQVVIELNEKLRVQIESN